VAEQQQDIVVPGATPYPFKSVRSRGYRTLCVSAPAANFSEQFGKKLYARRGDPA